MPWHVGFAFDFGRVAALRRTVETGHKKTCRRVALRAVHADGCNPGVSQSTVGQLDLSVK